MKKRDVLPYVALPLNLIDEKEWGKSGKIGKLLDLLSEL